MPRAVGRSGNVNQKRGVFLLRKVNLVTRDPVHLNPLLFHHKECASEAQQSNTKRALYPRVAKITRHILEREGERITLDFHDYETLMNSKSKLSCITCSKYR